MIGNNFTKFDTLAEYNTFKASSAYTKPNVSWIVNENIIMSEPYIKAIEAGTIVYYDGNALKFSTTSNWSSSLGTAVAVVVVPNTHTPDGTVRAMAVTGVNPDGSQANSDIDIAWGPMGTDTDLPNLDQVPCYNNIVGGTIDSYIYAYLSSNNTESGAFEGSTDCLDSNLHYCYDADDEGFYLSNPYLPDGSPNPDFRDTSIVTNNACADFNGASNTSVLVGLGIEYSAANACHLYSASGISAGNWYLPACGELGYIMPRFNQIQSSLSTVGGVQLGTGNGYWSSCEYSSVNARHVLTYDGDVNYGSKTYPFCVRPFCSIPASL